VEPPAAGGESPTFTGYFLDVALYELGSGFDVTLEETATGPILKPSRGACALGTARDVLLVWLLPVLPLGVAAGGLIPRGRHGGKQDSL
jgi:hypothetical protein